MLEKCKRNQEKIKRSCMEGVVGKLEEVETKPLNGFKLISKILL